MVPVAEDLAAEVSSQTVHYGTDVSQLFLGRQAFDVSTVPEHPSAQRHEHEQGACRQIQITGDLLN